MALCNNVHVACRVVLICAETAGICVTIWPSHRIPLAQQLHLVADIHFKHSFPHFPQLHFAFEHTCGGGLVNGLVVILLSFTAPETFTAAFGCRDEAMSKSLVSCC